MPAPVQPTVSTVVLVEGASDRLAVEALALRRGRNLPAEGISVVAMGGATNVGRFVDRLGPRGRGLRLRGLYDAAEEVYFRRALERAGLGRNLARADLAELGFHVCVADLEDELIRAVGAEHVERIVAEQGELGSFRIMQRQPAQRARPVDQQLRRFLGTRSGRKARYASVLARALDPACPPRPLDRVLGML